MALDTALASYWTPCCFEVRREQHTVFPAVLGVWQGCGDPFRGTKSTQHAQQRELMSSSKRTAEQPSSPDQQQSKKHKQMEIDENLHSRQLAVYGREAMKRMASAAVLISGANGVGVETGALARIVLSGGIPIALAPDLSMHGPPDAQPRTSSLRVCALSPSTTLRLSSYATWLPSST